VDRGEVIRVVLDCAGASSARTWFDDKSSRAHKVNVFFIFSPLCSVVQVISGSVHSVGTAISFFLTINRVDKRLITAARKVVNRCM